MYLNDEDLIKALCRCRENLTTGDDGKSGLIFVKENIKKIGIAFLDKSDFSLIRSADFFKIIFATCGF